MRTFRATLPSRARPRPVRPWLPRTIRSARRSTASLRISSAGSPMRTRWVTVPAARSNMLARVAASRSLSERALSTASTWASRASSRRCGATPLASGAWTCATLRTRSSASPSDGTRARNAAAVAAVSDPSAASTAVCAHTVRATRAAHGAWSTTSAATEPRRTVRRAPCPRLPTTTRSARHSVASSTILDAARPWRCVTSTSTPPSERLWRLVASISGDASAMSPVAASIGTGAPTVMIRNSVPAGQLTHSAREIARSADGDPSLAIRMRSGSSMPRTLRGRDEAVVGRRSHWPRRRDVREGPDCRPALRYGRKRGALLHDDPVLDVRDPAGHPGRELRVVAVHEAWDRAHEGDHAVRHREVDGLRRPRQPARERGPDLLEDGLVRPRLWLHDDVIVDRAHGGDPGDRVDGGLPLVPVVHRAGEGDDPLPHDGLDLRVGHIGPLEGRTHALRDAGVIDGQVRRHLDGQLVRDGAHARDAGGDARRLRDLHVARDGAEQRDDPVIYLDAELRVLESPVAVDLREDVQLDLPVGLAVGLGQGCHVPSPSALRD